MEAFIRRANKEDTADLREFLAKAGLGTEGITEETAEYFLLLENEDKSWRGTLGLEPAGENGLLRSLVVAPAQAKTDIFLLFEQALRLAKEVNIQHLFLASNKSSAISLFELLGFQLIDPNELPASLLVYDHIKHISNVDNLLFLKLSL